MAEEQIEVDHANPQDFSGSQESPSQYPGFLLQPPGSAWAPQECMLGQDKLLEALVLLSVFHLAAHDDFVPVNLSSCVEAMLSLGILSIRSGSLIATGTGKLIPSVGRESKQERKQLQKRTTVYV